EVKRRSADGSVGSPHARVGNCQASNIAEGHPKGWPFCAGAKKVPDAALPYPAKKYQLVNYLR
ncbi:hypothetical protein, partial [Pseudocitrobacter faecalis]|uniref:hypothetical protein n=1 Tax=Pseudocitrobacter faecalis TaxID=1398493 RepID=UPI003B9F79F5